MRSVAFVASTLILLLAFRLPLGAGAQTILLVVLSGFAFGTVLCAVATTVRRLGSVHSQRRYDS